MGDEHSHDDSNDEASDAPDEQNQYGGQTESEDPVEQTERQEESIPAEDDEDSEE